MLIQQNHNTAAKILSTARAENNNNKKQLRGSDDWGEIILSTSLQDACELSNQLWKILSDFLFIYLIFKIYWILGIFTTQTCIQKERKNGPFTTQMAPYWHKGKIKVVYV